MELDLRLAAPAVAAWGSAFSLTALPDARPGAAVLLWLCAIGAVVVFVVSAGLPATPEDAVALRGEAGPDVVSRRLAMSAVPTRLLSVVSLCAIAAALSATAVWAHGAVRQPASVLALTAGDRYVTATVRLSENVVPHPTAFADQSADGAPSGSRVRGTILALRVGDERLTLAVPVLVFVTTVVGGSGALRAGAAGDVDSGGGAGGVPSAGATPGAPGGVETDGFRAQLGSVIRVSGTMSPTDGADDVAFLLFARGTADFVESPPPLLGWANGLRSDLVSVATSLPGDGGALLPGLAIGDTSAVSDRLDAAMKDSSLSHLTAVSGANCAVVVAAVMMLGSAFRVRRSVRIAASLLALGGFVVLVTPQPSVLRAAVMASIVLVALASGRPTRGIPALSLAAIVLLVLDPWLARNYGFILSVLATTGLLVLSGPLTDVLGRVLPRGLAAVIALPVAAQLACQPVLILLTPTIPLYGVPANILAAPAAPLATMVGLVACLLLPVLPPLGVAAAALAWLPASWIAAVASFAAGLPGSRLPWLEGVVGLAALAAFTALLLVVVLRADGARIRRTLWGGLSAILLGMLVAMYAGGLLGTGIRDRLALPPDWQYAACDIGQGDAVLVDGGGAVALVDVGPDPLLLRQCLARLRVDRIDLLVLTHFDLDHVGGIEAVLGKVSSALVAPPETAADTRTIERLRAGGAVVTVAARGMTGTLGHFHWRVLWPLPKTVQFGAGNDGSVVMGFGGTDACEPRCLESIFLGDLGERAQGSMLAANHLGPVDVVKVAHHGSADQSGALYDRLDASIGLVSVGAENTYGHPTGELLALLARSGTTVARTDTQGLVVVGPGSAPGEFTMWSERPG